MHRPSNKDDRMMVLANWSTSFQYSHWAGPWTYDEYWPLMRAKLPVLLEKPGVKVLVSCNPSSPEQVFGWACYETGRDFPLLHYVYVKHDFRDHKDCDEKPRVAIKLLRELGMGDGKRFEYSFRTRAWDRFALTWRLNAKFCPEAVRGNKQREERA